MLFSLLLGLLAIYAYEALSGRPMAAALAVASIMLAAMLSRVSYGWLGVALCAGLYKTEGSRAKQALCVALLTGVYVLGLVLSGVERSWVLVSLWAVLAAVPVLLYNGKRGPRTPLLTGLFYASYPLHLIALVIVRALRVIPPYLFG